jgi:hypothetical protein
LLRSELGKRIVRCPTPWITPHNIGSIIGRNGSRAFARGQSENVREVWLGHRS